MPHAGTDPTTLRDNAAAARACVAAVFLAAAALCGTAACGRFDPAVVTWSDAADAAALGPSADAIAQDLPEFERKRLAVYFTPDPAPPRVRIGRGPAAAAAAGTIDVVVTGDVARDVAAARRALVAARLDRLTHGLPVHAWFRDGFCAWLARDEDRAKARDPLPGGLPGRLGTDGFLAWIGSVEPVVPGAASPEAARAEHRALSEDLFAALAGDPRPECNELAERYLVTFASLAAAYDDGAAGATANDDSAARILCRRRRDVPRERSIVAAFSPVAPLAYYARWCGQ